MVNESYRLTETLEEKLSLGKVILRYKFGEFALQNDNIVKMSKVQN
jgi:hypothetical protein